MTDTLYARASNGRIKEWKVMVEEKPDCAVLVRIHGYTDGKRQMNRKAISVGKNIGRSNETTPLEQAAMEAVSMRNSKKDEGYVEDISKIDDTGILLPMLAVDFHDQKHKIVYPAFVQPKLNGVRCLAKRDGDTIIYTSRKFKPFTTLEHLTSYLLDSMEDGDIYDGEIYHHGWTFQEVVRHVKKWREKTEELQYWVYDFCQSLDFEERHQWLEEQIFEPGCVKKVVTHVVFSESGVEKAHSTYVMNGYEGAMVRNKIGDYVYDYRSSNLQKFKTFIDAEFQIIGGHEGTGNDVGCVIFEVRNPFGTTVESGSFSVRPKGTVARRRAWFKDLDNLIGKDLTVRYQELSEDGVPIFPVGIEIRDYE